MTQRKATMTACATQDVLDPAMDRRWNLKFFDEAGVLVRTIPYITTAEAHRRVKSWEGTLDGQFAPN